MAGDIAGTAGVGPRQLGEPIVEFLSRHETRSVNRVSTSLRLGDLRQLEGVEDA
jgi:hypothetical protein